MEDPILAQPAQPTSFLPNHGASNPKAIDSVHHDNDTIDYWTTLLRKNLSKIQDPTAPELDEHDASTIPAIDEQVLQAPRRKSGRDSLAREIAARLYKAPPDSLGPIIKYEKDIVKLRSMVLNQRQSAIAKATERNARQTWLHVISAQGPWDEINDPLPLSGVPSLPMPVEQAEKESLAPFFAHLAGNGTHEPVSAPGHIKHRVSGVEPYYNTELLEFEKGVLYADGRMDLCKMVTGPRNIEALMEALKPNTFTKHFLLGNNIIGPVGAKAIARFIDEFPDRFETWYLAGNCIDTASFSVLVDSMVTSPAITNVWLKRNPLGHNAAKDLFRLITKTPNLRTLDLEQTELGDAGVAELFELLTAYTPSKPLALRHIYLNACGISHAACTQISHFLQSPNCTLESLYLSKNPIGDAVTALTPGLQQNTTLTRLILQSCGLKDPGIISLSRTLQSHPTLTLLDIGQSYATADLGMRYNWITCTSFPSLAALVSTTKLEYLDIGYTPATQSSLHTLLTAASTSPSLLWLHMRPLTTGGKDTASVRAGQEYTRLSSLARSTLHSNVRAKYAGMPYERFEAEKKRFLVSSEDVRFIDSVYRNRDAGEARRGLKRLEKWWGEGDDTLVKVQEGTLV